MKEIPTDFRILPTDKELVNFLLDKVNNPSSPVPDTIFTGFDLYGEHEPWKLPFKYDDQELYFFTTLKKLSEKRIQRSAGCGSWKGQTTGDEIYKKIEGKEELIGLRKMLVFEVKKKDNAKPNPTMEWQLIMHEYSLCGHSLKQLNHCDNNVVLCRIRRKRPNGYKEEPRRIIGKRKMDQEPDAAILDQDGVAGEVIQKLMGHSLNGPNMTDDPVQCPIWQEGPAAATIEETNMNQEPNRVAGHEVFDERAKKKMRTEPQPILSPRSNSTGTITFTDLGDYFGVVLNVANEEEYERQVYLTTMPSTHDQLSALFADLALCSTTDINGVALSEATTTEPQPILSPRSNSTGTITFSDLGDDVRVVLNVEEDY